MSRSRPLPDRSSGALWVCWTPPSGELGRGDTLLSFLPPAQEDTLACRYGERCVRAREASRPVRADARRLYVDLVARLGLVRMRDGRTMRQALTGPASAVSRWWYHPVTFRDCEDVPIFDRIIAVLTIQAMAQRVGAVRLVMMGAPADVVAALRGKFSIEARGTRTDAGAGPVWLRALASRARYGLRTLWRWTAVRGMADSRPAPFEVALSGFWDWSVWRDPQHDRMVDRYFRDLPDLLRQQGRRVGWLAWFDPARDPTKPARALRKVLAPAARRSDVVIVQRFLRPSDIIRAVADLSALHLFLRIRKHLASVLRQDGVDWTALFTRQLLRGFADATLPHHELVALATERACRLCRPQVTVSFLEHAPHSRAHYDGVRRADAATTCYAVQHASYSHEKTFLCLHSSHEFQGAPDGCATPHPDYVCVMGTLGQRLFRECGYPEDRVLLTGSTRYDTLREQRDAPPDPGGDSTPSEAAAEPRSDWQDQPLRILMVCGLNVELELDMVQALCEAVRGMEGVIVRLRSHPFRQIESAPGWARYTARVTMTQGSLEDDIAEADLLVFTYSTVAEEAFVAGKHVWQWLPLGFNGSALAEAAAIPQFSSVAQLGQALRAFREDPRPFQPSPEAMRTAKEQLFYLTDGQAAQRVSAAILQRLREPRIHSPLVSVVIPAYNAAAFIERTLESVRTQRTAADEVIVVDDGSTDGMAETVTRFFERHSMAGRCLRQPNTGIASARNAGLRAARGAYIALLDADDRWYPDKLQRVLQEFERHPEAGLVCSNEHIMMGPRLLRTSRTGPAASRMYERLLFRGNLLCTSTSVFRAEIGRAIGGFREQPEFNTVEDYDFWMRFSQAAPLRFIPDVLGAYEVREDGVSRRVVSHHTNLEHVLRDHFAAYFGDRPGPVARWRIRRRLSTVYRSAAGQLMARHEDPDRQRTYVLQMLQAYPIGWRNLVRALLWATRTVLESLPWGRESRPAHQGR